jgi:hypothetical protein
MPRLMRSVLIMIIFFSCADKTTRPDELILNRIEYVYSLKSIIDQNIWKDFDDKRFDVPLIYYNDTCCYVANPTDKFLRLFKPRLVFENEKIKIYKTDSLIDDIPFHMETSILFGDTSRYQCRSPFMACSSLELTKRKIKELTGSELWATMVIHEYFHGFQFKHNDCRDYVIQHIATVPPDSLPKFYHENEWFRESVDKENELLLAAIRVKQYSEASNLIRSFFELRDKRRQKTMDELKIDVKTVEEIYETMEGAARYTEYGLYNVFLTKPVDHKLEKTDTSYHSYKYFLNFKLENEKWMYLTNETTYFYATGFNLARLLEKMKIEFKQRLFNEPGLSLEEVLRQEFISATLARPSADSQTRRIR